MQTASAVQMLKYHGEVAELELLKKIHIADGSSVYALAKAMAWSYGKTERAVERLLSKGLVKTKEGIENGRAHKKIFETEAAELIDFSKQELELMERYLKGKTGSRQAAES